MIRCGLPKACNRPVVPKPLDRHAIALSVVRPKDEKTKRFQQALHVATSTDVQLQQAQKSEDVEGQLDRLETRINTIAAQLWPPKNSGTK